MRNTKLLTMAVAVAMILPIVCIAQSDGYSSCSPSTAHIVSGGSNDVTAVYFDLEFDNQVVILNSASWSVNMSRESLLKDVNLVNSEGVLSFSSPMDIEKKTVLVDLAFTALSSDIHTVEVTVKYSHSDRTITSEVIELSISGNHSLISHPYKAATETSVGNTAYWECAECGKYFSDRDGNIEIEKGSWIIPKLEPELLPIDIPGPEKQTDEGSIIVPQGIIDEREATTDDIVFNIEAVDSSKLTDKQREAIADNYAVDINLTIKEGTVHKFGTTTVVKLKFAPVEGKDMSKTIVKYVAEDGSTEDMATQYSDGEITFETNHLSVFMVVLSDYTQPIDEGEKVDGTGNDGGVSPFVIAVIGVGIIAILAIVLMIIRRRSTF